VAVFEHGRARFAVVTMPQSRGKLERLTAAEFAVALLVSAGATNAEIAHSRKTSVRTVSNQVAGILCKLGAHGRRGISAQLLQDCEPARALAEPPVNRGKGRSR